MLQSWPIVGGSPKQTLKNRVSKLKGCPNIFHIHTCKYHLNLKTLSHTENLYLGYLRILWESEVLASSMTFRLALAIQAYNSVHFRTFCYLKKKKILITNWQVLHHL